MPISPDPTRNGTDFSADRGNAATAGNDALLSKWQRWIKLGEGEQQRLKPELDRAMRLWKGKRQASGDNDRNQAIDSGAKNEMVRINALRLRIEKSVDYIYAKNPKTAATVKKPIMIPETNPDGTQVMIETPEGREISMKDVSEKRAEIVEAIMDHYIQASGLKQHAKAAGKEAFYRHGAWVQVGIDYDEDEQEEIVFQKWHRFEDVISDPKAVITEGRLERCRFVAVRLQYTEEEAKKKNLAWAEMKNDQDIRDQAQSDPDSETRTCYQMWDKETQLFGFCSCSGAWVRPPQAWPFKCDGLPWSVLVFATSPGEKWQRPPILEAESTAEEQIIFRDTFFEKVVMRRPMLAVDESLDSKLVSAIVGRGRNAAIKVPGLAAGRKIFEIQNTEDITEQEWALYQQNERTLDGFFPVTAGDMGSISKATATEITDASNRQTGHADAMRDIFEDFLREIIRKARQIMETTIQNEKIIEVVGKDGAKYWAPYDGSVLADVDIDIEVGSTVRMNKEVQKQLAINAMNVGATIQPPQPGAVDMPKIYIDFLKAQGNRNADKYLVPLPPPMPVPPQMPPGQPMPPAPPTPGTVPGAGATTGLDPAAAVAGQMNAMK